MLYTTADSFLISVASLFLRSIALLTLAGFAYLLCRKKSAAIRHRILLMGTVGLGVLPLLLFVPALHLNIGGTLPTIKAKSFSPLVQQQQRTPIFAPIVDQPGAPDIHPREQARIVTIPAVQEGLDRTPTPATAEPDIANTVNVAASPKASPNISEWVLGVWIFGVLTLFARLIASHAAAWKLTSTSSAPTQLLALCDGKELAGTRVLASEKIDMPMTWGLRPATILLPTEAVNTWGPNRLNAVLLHETAHVRRSDWLSQLLSEVILAVYWPNPLIWFCCRRLRLEAELACDDRVLSTGLAPSEYASELIECVRQARRKLSVGAAAVAMADKNAVSARVKAALDTKRSRAALHRGGAMAAALAGLALTFVIGAASTNKATVFGDEAKPPTPGAATQYTKTLSNGITVSVAGVTSDVHGDNRRGWWAPDGAPTSDPTVEGRKFAMVSNNFASQYVRRDVCLTLSSPKAMTDVTVAEGITRPEIHVAHTEGFLEVMNGVSLPQNTRLWGRFPVAFNKPTDLFDYRFYIASGPWQTEGTFGKEPAKIPNLAFPQRFKNQGLKAKNVHVIKWNQQFIACAPNQPVDRRIIEFNAAGKIMRVMNFAPFQGNVIITNPSTIPQDKGAKFEVQKRPFVWVDFENISNTPTVPKAAGSEADVIPIPSAPEAGALYTQSLPNGITAGLVGVTSDVLGGNSEGWWAADGTPIGDPSEDGPSFAKASHNYGDQYVRRYVCLTISSAKAMNNVTVARMITKPHVSVAGSDGELDIVPGVSLEPNVRLWGKFPVAFNGPTDRFNYKFGIASGPWRTTNTKANTLVSSLSTAVPAGWNGPYATVTIGQQSGVQLFEENNARTRTRSFAKELTFNIAGNSGELVDRRVIALDAQGNVVPLKGWSPVPGNNSFAGIPIAAFRRITKFELQTRPFVWAEFGNIRSAPVVPKGTYSVTNDIPIPPALPGFSKTLPDGSKISVAALMRGRSDGEAWWLPDGSLLSGRITPWTAIALSPDNASSNSDEQSRMVFIRLTSRHAVDREVKVELTTDNGDSFFVPKTRSNYFPAGGTAAGPVDWTINTFLKGSKSAGTIHASVGVTTGQWKKAGTIRVDQTMPFRSLLTGDVSVREGSRSSITWLFKKGSSRLLYFNNGPQMNPETTALRVVAVMKDGSRQTLTSNVSWSNGDVGTTVSVNSPKQTGNSYSTLNNVVQFELDTQPYSWVTFPTIPFNPKE
jgi:beta-lactamase regulating signal transducer with metallopeptidase domain